MIKKIFTHPFVFFPLVSFLFFWPLSLQLLTFKNDALTYYYPVRTLISDALNNGELPLWTPYINMGYPLHADLQSGAWNPVIWFFSLATGYSLSAFHYEFLFYVAFAGVGFYYLCRDHGATNVVAVILGLSYQFSGFVIDSAQFFVCISSACYLPFIVLFFSRMIRLNRWRDAVYAGIFLSLLFTGGYPSLFVGTGYVLLAYAIFKFGKAQKKKAWFINSVPLCALMAVTFLLLSLPAIFSFVEYLPLIKRGNALSLAAAHENPMHPASIVSMLAPFANTGTKWAVNASILMQSMYVGLLPLIFLVSSLQNKAVKTSRITIVLLAGSVLFLTLAMGEYFITHELAYKLLPFMNSFRHPGVFRIFSLFLFLLAINTYSQQIAILTVKPALRKTIVVTFMGLIACGLLLALRNGMSNLLILLTSPSIDSFRALHFSDRYLVQLPFLLFILSFTYRALQKRSNVGWLCVLAAADMFVFVQLCMPVTVTGARSLVAVERHFDRNPVRFPLPGDRSIAENSINSEDKLLITGSKIPFSKHVGRNNYYITPGNLQLQDSFYASPIRDKVFANSFAYLADTSVTYSYPRDSNPETLEQATAYLNRGVLSGAPSQKLPAHVYAFSANEVKIKIDSTASGQIILLQNFYPGWKVFADGKPKTIEVANISYMAVTIDRGTKDLVFVYRPGKIFNGFYIAAFTWLTILILAISDLSSLRPAKTRQRGT